MDTPVSVAQQDFLPVVVAVQRLSQIVERELGHIEKALIDLTGSTRYSGKHGRNKMDISSTNGVHTPRSASRTSGMSSPKSISSGPIIQAAVLRAMQPVKLPFDCIEPASSHEKGASGEELSVAQRQLIKSRTPSAEISESATGSSHVSRLSSRDRAPQSTSFIARLTSPVYDPFVGRQVSPPAGIRCVQRFVYSLGFTVASHIVTLLNTALIGYQSELMLACALDRARGTAGLDPAFSDPLFAMELIFALWMTLELLLTVYVERERFFKCEDRGWHIFDVLVWIASIAALFMPSVNLTYLRIIRVVMRSKGFRHIWLSKSLHGLNQMVISLKGSLTHLLHGCCIMYFFTILFSIFIAQEITYQLDTGPMANSTAGESKPVNIHSEPWGLAPVSGNDSLDDLKCLYGTVTLIASTLFRAMSGGNDWADLAYPIAKIWWFFALVFVAYVAIMVFGVLNILTGVFVDTSMQAAQNNRDNAIATDLRERDTFLKRIRDIFDLADRDGSATVSVKELNRVAEDESLMAYLRSLGVHVEDAMELFRVFDEDGDGEVSIDEFTNGCLRMRGGQARAVDMMTLLYQNKANFRRVESFQLSQRSWATELEARLANLEKKGVHWG